MKYSMVPPVARYEFPLAKHKVAGYVMMGIFLVVIFFSRGESVEISTGELLSILLIAALVVAYPCFVVIPYLKYKSAIVRVTPEGLIDLRKSPEPQPWGEIKFADVKRGIFGGARRAVLPSNAGVPPRQPAL